VGPIWGGNGLGLDQSMMEFVAFAAKILVIWFAIMGVTGWQAGRRGRDGGTWAVIAFFTGPFALIALLLLPRQVPPPESEAARLEEASPSGIRLVDDSELELDMAGRLARLGGQLAARINGRPSFRLGASSQWHWSDGTAMTDEERAQLRHDLPRIGQHDGWVLTLDATDRT
jgi:hypothetical protein